MSVSAQRGRCRRCGPAGLPSPGVVELDADSVWAGPMFDGGLIWDGIFSRGVCVIGLRCDVKRDWSG